MAAARTADREIARAGAALPGSVPNRRQLRRPARRRSRSVPRDDRPAPQVLAASYANTASAIPAACTSARERRRGARDQPRARPPSRRPRPGGAPGSDRRARARGRHEDGPSGDGFAAPEWARARASAEATVGQPANARRRRPVRAPDVARRARLTRAPTPGRRGEASSGGSPARPQRSRRSARGIPSAPRRGHPMMLASPAPWSRKRAASPRRPPRPVGATSTRSGAAIREEGVRGPHPSEGQWHERVGTGARRSIDVGDVAPQAPRVYAPIGVRRGVGVPCSDDASAARGAERG